MYFVAENKIFKKPHLGTSRQDVYQANSNVCIYSLTFHPNSGFLYWAEGCGGDGIYYIDPTIPTPNSPTKINIPTTAPKPLYGVEIHGGFVYWTAVEKVCRAPISTGQPWQTVRDIPGHQRINGIVMVP